MDIYLSRVRVSTLVLLMFSAVAAAPASARVELDSSRLQMMSPDQVNKLLHDKIRVAQRVQSRNPTPEKVDSRQVDALRDALRIAFSRPDQDGSRSDMFALVRRELGAIGETESVIRQLAQEGAEALKRENGPLPVRATYVVMLENIMAEIRPEIDENKELREAIELIRDANIRLPSNLRRHSLLRNMSKLKSPSETAAALVPRSPPKSN